MIYFMTETDEARLPGRGAEAARNNELILEAAREVFVADPDAPITAVAKRAGVGISALYSRYSGKEELLRKLSRDGLQRYFEEIELAANDDRDPWTVFAEFMLRLLDADIAALTLSLAGKFTPTEDMFELAGRTDIEMSERLFPKVKPALRPGTEVQDVSVALEFLGTVSVRDPERTKQLRRRYLAIVLDGLRVEHTDPLPGPPPSRDEINERWQGPS
jgi:AcrR family transcriptional regulator